jgi:hypothetical protein
MDQELRQYLDVKFTDVHMDVAKLEQYVDAKFAEVHKEFQKFATTVATKQDLERVETALLTEFHKWASPLEARMRTHTAALRAVDAEMEALTDRVQKLEGK